MEPLIITALKNDDLFEVLFLMMISTADKAKIVLMMMIARN